MSETFSFKGESSILSANYYPPIELDKPCSLGLIGFYTWNSIPNIEENVNNQFTYDNKIIRVPTGSYEITDIESYLKKQITAQITENKTKRDKLLSIKANNNTLKCEIKCAYDIDFRENNSIGPLLGFSHKLLKANTLHVSDLPVAIIKVTTIRVECNITASSYYNDSLSHTLFEFSPTVDPGYKIVVEPRNIIYLPVNVDSISNITLKVVDQNGRLINFRGETVLIRLELKKLEY